MTEKSQLDKNLGTSFLQSSMKTIVTNLKKCTVYTFTLFRTILHVAHFLQIMMSMYKSLCHLHRNERTQPLTCQTSQSKKNKVGKIEFSNLKIHMKKYKSV